MKKNKYFLVDYHTHPYAHGRREVTLSYLKQFIDQAQKNNIQELGFSDHDIYLDQINWSYLKKIKKTGPISVKLGLEIGYRPGKEQVYGKMREKYNLDFLIGSVHFIKDWNFDHPAYREEFKKREINQVYQDYFDLLIQAFNTELFDIVGHLDLIKVFGYFPKKKTLLDFVRPVLDVIKKNDMVVEINTNGVNKPVNEIYPAREVIKKMYQLDIPVTLASDAHAPDRVGAGLKEAAALLEEIGYRQIAVLNNGNIEMKNLLL